MSLSRRPFSRTLSFLLALVIGLFAAAALAQESPEPSPDELLDLILSTSRAVYRGVVDGHWGVVAGALLLVSVFVFRAILKVQVDEDGEYSASEKVRLFLTRTDLGGVVSTLIVALVGALGTALLAGQDIGSTVLIGAIPVITGGSTLYVYGGHVWAAWKNRGTGAWYLPKEPPAPKAGA